MSGQALGIITLTKRVFFIPTYQKRSQSVHIHSLSAVIQKKGSYSASKQRFLTVVSYLRAISYPESSGFLATCSAREFRKNCTAHVFGQRLSFIHLRIIINCALLRDIQLLLFSDRRICYLLSINGYPIKLSFGVSRRPNSNPQPQP